MLRKSILLSIAIIICSLLFSGCDDKSEDQMQLELEQLKATLDKTQVELKLAQSELKSAQSELEEAKKWKDEYDKLYIVNQNQEGRLLVQRKQVQDLADRVVLDQETIIKLQEELQKKIPNNPFQTPPMIIP